MQNDLKVQVSALFPTPVAAVTLPDAALHNAALHNAALKSLILERRQSGSATQASNLGGWQSGWSMESWGGAHTKAILDAAKAVADKLTVRRGGQPTQQAWRCNCWANVNAPGDSNEFHCHPGAFCSGCYYVDDGGIGTAPEAGGSFEMTDPRGPGPALYTPHLAYAMLQGYRRAAARPCSRVAACCCCFRPGCCIRCAPIEGKACTSPWPSISASRGTTADADHAHSGDRRRGLGDCPGACRGREPEARSRFGPGIRSRQPRCPRRFG